MFIRTSQCRSWGQLWSPALWLPSGCPQESWRNQSEKVCIPRGAGALDDGERCFLEHWPELSLSEQNRKGRAAAGLVWAMLLLVANPSCRLQPLARCLLVERLVLLLLALNENLQVQAVLPSSSVTSFHPVPPPPGANREHTKTLPPTPHMETEGGE